MDGKAERGTVQDNGRNPDIVSAYSHNTGITLASEACREKSNEITVILRLINKINISGKTITVDTMSMQKCIVDKKKMGRKHALGTGLQSAAGQDKAQVGKSRTKP